MQNNTESVCRCCLKLVHSANNVDLLNEVMREMLSLLSIKLDLNVSEHPSVCGMCLGFLDEIYLFKSKCLHTEDIISAHIDTNSKVSLRDLLIEIDNKRNVPISEDQVICRLCMKIPPNGSYIALGETGEEISLSRYMIQSHLPEMDLNITEKPIMCNSCHVCFKSYVSFATNCKTVEEKIKLYCDFQKSRGPVDLACVRQFTEDKAFDIQTRLSKDLVIKHEEGSVVIKVEKAWDAEDFVSDGNFLDSGSGSELLLKNEEIDIKSENDEISEEMGHYSVPSGPSDHSGKSGSLKRKREIRQSAAKGRKHLSSDDHIARQKGLSWFDCKECSFETDKDYALTQHMVKHKDKSEVEMHKCDTCEFETRYKCSMKKHMLKHCDPKAEKKFKCDKCLYETIRKSNLRIHILMIHKDKSEVEIHKCENCEFETRYKNSMTKHMRRKHRDPEAKRKFMCDKCPYETDFKFCLTRHNLSRHSLTHKDKSEVDMLKCENCEFETRYKGGMIRHMVKHRDPIAERKFKCDKCPYETDFKSYLCSHNLIHKDKSEVEMHKCDNCEYETRYKYSMVKHMRRKHRDPKTKRKFMCDKCPYETDFKFSLHKHDLIHKDKSEVEIHKCENCEYETRYKGCMIQHMVKHRDPRVGRAFKCDKCPYETNFKFPLIRHNLIHKDKSEVEMHKCDNCEYETRHKYNLIRHMEKHLVPIAEKKI